MQVSDGFRFEFDDDFNISSSSSSSLDLKTFDTACFITGICYALQIFGSFFVLAVLVNNKYVDINQKFFSPLLSIAGIRL